MLKLISIFSANKVMMRVEVLGEGKPEYAVVACVHGDETCGWHAFNRFKREGFEIEKPVKLILANERAFKLGKRYCDTDLNRICPGDPDSDLHEERLAYSLRKELEGLKFLDIHSSESLTTSLGITVGQKEEKLELLRNTGVDRVVDMDYVDGGITRDLEGVVVESGYKDDQKAAENAYRMMKNFLAAHGVIDAGSETGGDPEIFEVYGTGDGSGFRFVAENFKKVEEGEVYARKQAEEKVAEEDFYPVLMSTSGYEDMVGFKAKKVE